MKRILLAASMAFSALLLSQNSHAQDHKQFEDEMAKYLASDKGQDALIDALQKAGARRQQQAMQKQLEDQFKNPVNVDITNSPVRGPKDAKVTIVEFSDFECPFCKRGHATTKQIMQAYPNDVKFVYKNRPLAMHKNAELAAKASVAAGMQGKFWEMCDALFENQNKLGQAFYEEQAKKLGLNVDKFKADMISEAVAKNIKADAEQADKLGVNGTPGFFVNGVSVQGAQPFDMFKTVIDKVLADMKAKK